MKAVIETGGKQYYVQKGDIIYVEKVDVNIDENVKFDVISVGSKIGLPYVEGASVTGKVLKQGKQKKIVVFKYRAKKNYRKKQGHRQPYTKIEIVEINE